MAHPPRSRRRPHGDRLGQSACNARGIHLASKHNNRVRARPAIQHWVNPQMGSSSTLVGEGRCDNPPSAPAIVLTHHAEISPWCGWHQAPTRLPECGTPGLEEYPREGNKQQASAGRQKSMRCPHSSCTVALCRNAGTGGTITVNQEQLPRLQGLTGDIAAEQLPFLNSGPSRDSSRSLSWCQPAAEDCMQ